MEESVSRRPGRMQAPFYCWYQAFLRTGRRKANVARQLGGAICSKCRLVRPCGIPLVVCAPVTPGALGSGLVVSLMPRG